MNNIEVGKGLLYCRFTSHIFFLVDYAIQEDFSYLSGAKFTGDVMIIDQ